MKTLHLCSVLCSWSLLIVIAEATDHPLHKRNELDHQLDDCHHHCQHGTCVVNQAMLQHFGPDHHELVTCDCDLGWEGHHCEHDQRHLICGTKMCHHGQCGLRAHLLVGRDLDDHTCVCRVGFAGDQCDQEAPRTRCDPFRCLRGNCVTDNHNHRSCHCDPGWSGPNCDIGGEPCGHEHCLHGHCAGRCVCDGHWSGKNCDIPGTQCRSGPCYYGHCDNSVHPSRCACDANWSGTFCDNYTHPATTAAPTTTTTMALTTAAAPRQWTYNTCDKAQIVSQLANQLTSSDNQAFPCPSGSHTSPSALVLSTCTVSGHQSWTPGQKVMDDCPNIPPFTPIASFPVHSSGYIADGGLCGVFLGCLSDGFKMASQVCDSAANITQIHRGGAFNHNPHVYYTIQ